MENYRLIPEKYRFLNSSWLKLIAVVTMVVDHIAYVFLKKDQTVFLLLFGLQIARFAGHLGPVFRSL